MELLLGQQGQDDRGHNNHRLQQAAGTVLVQPRGGVGIEWDRRDEPVAQEFGQRLEHLPQGLLVDVCSVYDCLLGDSDQHSGRAHCHLQ
jgi:hypothetical protein